MFCLPWVVPYYVLACVSVSLNWETIQLLLSPPLTISVEDQLLLMPSIDLKWSFNFKPVTKIALFWGECFYDFRKMANRLPVRQLHRLRNQLRLRRRYQLQKQLRNNRPYCLNVWSVGVGVGVPSSYCCYCLLNISCLPLIVFVRLFEKRPISIVFSP